MKDMWADLIDINAGPIATGEATIQEIGTLLFMKLLMLRVDERNV
jgi:galactarate dehydratase